MAKRVKMHNPFRAKNPVETLAIINHGGRTMTRKKTVPNKRRSTANTKGKKTSARRRNRRRNPSLQGIAAGALYAFGGAAVTNIVGGYLPIQLQGWPAIGLRFVIAYLAGFAAEKFKLVTPQNAQLIAIGGASSAAGDAVNLLLGAQHPLTQQTGNLQLPGTGNGQPTGNGTGDIVRFPYRGVGDIVQAPDGMRRTAMA
jgi:hypothetical protein